MSKYQFTASDIYVSGTDIPQNRLRTTEPELLHEIEETLLQQAYQTFISEYEPERNIDASTIQIRRINIPDWTGSG